MLKTPLHKANTGLNVVQLSSNSHKIFKIEKVSNSTGSFKLFQMSAKITKRCLRQQQNFISEVVNLSALGQQQSFVSLSPGRLVPATSNGMDSSSP